MKKPRDVPTDYFKEMLASAPDGARLLKSARPRLLGGRAWWRDFTFMLTKPAKGGGKLGDYLIMSCPCKFERRS